MLHLVISHAKGTRPLDHPTGHPPMLVCVVGGGDASSHNTQRTIRHQNTSRGKNHVPSGCAHLLLLISPLINPAAAAAPGHTARCALVLQRTPLFSSFSPPGGLTSPTGGPGAGGRTHHWVTPMYSTVVSIVIPFRHFVHFMDAHSPGNGSNFFLRQNGTSPVGSGKARSGSWEQLWQGVV